MTNAIRRESQRELENKEAFETKREQREITLLRAVLERAVSDLKLSPRSIEYRQAKTWFRSQSKKFMSFRWLAEQIDHDPDKFLVLLEDETQAFKRVGQARKYK